MAAFSGAAHRLTHKNKASWAARPLLHSCMVAGLGAESGRMSAPEEPLPGIRSA
jgi:hypothetical protein